MATDIAKILLANAQAEPNQKALAQLAFENTHHEDALAEHLKGLNIPLETKADLWDAKRITRNDPRLHKLSQIANLPKEVLKTAEEHPNVMKLLMTEEKSEKSASEKKEPKAKEAAKEEVAENAQSAKEPLDLTVPMGDAQPRPQEPRENEQDENSETAASPSLVRSSESQNEFAHDYHVDPSGQVLHTPNPLVQT